MRLRPTLLATLLLPALLTGCRPGGDSAPPLEIDAIGPRTWLLATCAGWAVLAWLLALFGMPSQRRDNRFGPIPDGRPLADR